MKRIINTLLLAAALLATASCRHKELCYDHTHVVNLQVAFDWKYAPDANPETMAVYFYSKTSGESYSFELQGAKGGTVRLPIGEYEALCLNNDTENVVYRTKESLGSFEVTTKPGDLLSDLSALSVRSSRAPRAAGTEDERVALPPERVYTGVVKDIVLDYSKDDHSVTIFPKPAVCDYSVEVRGAENLKYVLGTSATLASLSGGWFPGLERTSDEAVTVPFNTVFSIDEGTIIGAFRTFGTSKLYRHVLTIYAVLADESSWYYTYDVTDQVVSAPDPFNVHIVVDGLPFPKPITNGGGFHPTVEPWQGVVIPIEM